MKALSCRKSAPRHPGNADPTHGDNERKDQNNNITLVEEAWPQIWVPLQV